MAQDYNNPLMLFETLNFATKHTRLPTAVPSTYMWFPLVVSFGDIGSDGSGNSRYLGLVNIRGSVWLMPEKHVIALRIPLFRGSIRRSKEDWPVLFL